MMHAIRRGVLDNGDDMALVVATELFHPDVFTVEACAGYVDGMLQRLESQHIDEIGDIKVGAVSGAGTTEVVRLQSWGKHRLAVVKFYTPTKMGRMKGEDWYTPSGTEFVNWIDDDFGDFAASVQEIRHGNMKTIDVTTGHSFGPDVQSWVERTAKAVSR